MWSAKAAGFAAVLAFLSQGPGQAVIGEISVDAVAQETAPKASNDKSTLWIHSGTRAVLILVDEKQRRAGVDPKTHETLHEIPHSQSEVDFIENRYTGDPYAELDQHITIAPASKGVYHLRLIGVEDGPYQISISALGRNGSSLPTKDLDGLISEGQEKQMRLSFDPTTESRITVIEETPAR